MATLQLCIVAPPPNYWLVKKAIYGFCQSIAYEPAKKAAAEEKETAEKATAEEKAAAEQAAAEERAAAEDNSIDEFCHSVVLAYNIDVDTYMYVTKRTELEESFKLGLKGVKVSVQYLQNFAATNLNIKFKDIKKIFTTAAYKEKYLYRDALNVHVVSLADLLTTDGGVKSDSVMPKLSQLKSFMDMQKSTPIEDETIDQRLNAAMAQYKLKFSTALEENEDGRKMLFGFAFCMAFTNPETKAEDAHKALSAVRDDFIGLVGKISTEFDSEEVFNAGFEAGRLSKL